MRLYLIRHAEAVPLDANGMTDDSERPLTDLGHEFVFIDFDAKSRRCGYGQIAFLGFERIFQQVFVSLNALLLNQEIGNRGGDLAACGQ